MMFSLGLTFVIKTNKQTKPPPQQTKKNQTNRFICIRFFKNSLKYFEADSMSGFVPTAKLLRISNLGTNSYAASLYLIGKKFVRSTV